MSQNKVYRAIGLMSGTSLDGEIDVALIETDGQDFVKALDFYAHPYDIAIRDKVRACFGKQTVDQQTLDAEELVTQIHIDAVKASGFNADIIGFHGQTITHDPDNSFTWQLGNGKRLAQETAIDVIYDMRQADIKASGQGAPIAPLYHKAITSDVGKPVCVLNLGGVANVTYIGPDGDLIAFDTGPANALIDDAVKQQTGQAYDAGGNLARSGMIDGKALEDLLNHPYFDQKPPKSLDRNSFGDHVSVNLNLEDTLATLTSFSVQGIVKACNHFPDKPKAWYVCGGGRHNDFMMENLNHALHAPVNPIEEIGYNSDAIEAQAFAYLAVRSLLGYFLTLPQTTGVSEPMTGGILAKAKE